ncbi:MAG: DNA/RNA nuclease SfsA, partial [Eubacteriales bacterium]|nr:DNA/RNA nuclease SfsA [Eubacteriales bacterium]
ILFIIQMKDVSYFKPNEETHLEFAEALKTAFKNGVKILAYDCFVNETKIELKDRVLIKLD